MTERFHYYLIPSVKIKRCEKLKTCRWRSAPRVWKLTPAFPSTVKNFRSCNKALLYADNTSQTMGGLSVVKLRKRYWKNTFLQGGWFENNKLLS